jgi:WD40 repeat protein
VLKGHTDAIWDVALHPTLSLVLTASADESIKLWDFGASSTRTLL